MPNNRAECYFYTAQSIDSMERWAEKKPGVKFGIRMC
jgi:hypothetical protein